jgi:hypothetical protein
VADSRVDGNEPSGSIKGEKFREQLSDYLILEKVSAVWINLIWRKR